MTSLISSGNRPGYFCPDQLLKMTLYNEMAAVLLIRIFLGILFFWQGFDKVFNLKIRGVIETFKHPLIEKHFPPFLIPLAAYYTSYIELIGGFLLIIGFAKYIVLYLLGIDLLMVSLAFSIIKPMWDLQQIFTRLVLIAALLVLPSHWDVISLDYITSLYHFQ
jgi:putative oxidoreductase